MASSELNSLNIIISADATPATTALEGIRTKASETKKVLDDLSASATLSNNAFKDLVKSLTAFTNVSATDPFGLKQAAKDMADVQTMARSSASTLSQMGTSLTKMSEKFRNDLNIANETANKIIGKFSVPRNLFAIDNKTQSYLDKIPGLFAQSAADRNDRRALIREEQAHLKERVSASKSMTENAAKRVGMTKQEFEDLKVGTTRIVSIAKSLSKISDPEAFGRRVEITYSEIAKKTADAIAKAAGVDGKKGNKKNNEKTDHTLTNKLSSLITAFNRNIDILQRNNTEMEKFRDGINRLGKRFENAVENLAKSVSRQGKDAVGRYAPEALPFKERGLASAVASAIQARSSMTPPSPPGKKDKEKDNRDAIERNTLALRESINAYTHFGATMFYADMGARAYKYGYDKIANLQQMQARSSAWGLTRNQQLQFDAQTLKLKQNNPLMSMSDAYSMMMSASSSLGHYDPKLVGQTVQQVTRYAQMEKALGYNASEITDIAKNYYGVAEARQVANDVQKTLETFRTVFRITTTTAGKITVGDVETILRNLGPGAATITDEGLLRLLAYAEQVKVAGRGASGSAGAGISTVGTNVKMLQLMAMGKPSSIHAKKMLAELGLLEDGAYIQNGDGTYSLNYNGKENVQEAQLIQRLLKGQGGLNQVIGDIALGSLKTFSSVGFYDKELAQQDPVKFVETIMPLIEAYTVKGDRRAEYFGEKGRESYAKGQTDQEFYDQLTVAELTSAMTTFWAKTGLSQRVVAALATFANRNFQERSQNMMETALQQKGVDQLMREQIEGGNLTLATQRVEKSIESLVQSFEPLGKITGKAMLWVADMIDALNEWVDEWNGLAAATGALLVFKAVTSITLTLLGTYDLLNTKMKKSAAVNGVLTALEAKRTRELEKQALLLSGGKVVPKPEAKPADNSPAKPIPMPAGGSAPTSGSKPNAAPATSGAATAAATVSIWKAATNKVKAQWHGVMAGVYATAKTVFGAIIGKLIPGIGTALMILDIGSVVYDWLSKFEWFADSVGKVLGDIPNPFTQWKVSRDVIEWWKLGSEANTTGETKAELDKIEAKRQAAWEERNRLIEQRGEIIKSDSPFMGLFGNNKYSNWDKETKETQKTILSDQITQLTKTINDLDLKADDLKTGYRRRIEEFDAKLASFGEAFNAAGGQEALRNMNTALGNLDEAQKNLEFAKSNMPDKVNEFQQIVDQRKEELNDALEAYANIFNDEKVKELAVALQKWYADLKSMTEKTFFGDRYLKSQKNLYDQAGKNTAKYFDNYLEVDSGEKIATANKLDPQRNSIVDPAPQITVIRAQTQVDQRKATEIKDPEEQADEARREKLPQLPNKTLLAKFTVLEGDIQKWKKEYRDAARPVQRDAYGNTVKDMAYYEAQAREEFLKNWVSGKYRSKEYQPFVKVGSHTINGTYTEENLDWNAKAYPNPKDPNGGSGQTAAEIAHIRALALAAKDFFGDVNTAINSQIKSVRTLKQDVIDLQREVESWAVPDAVKQNENTARDFNRETDERVAGLMKGRQYKDLNIDERKQIVTYLGQREEEKSLTMQKSMLEGAKAYDRAAYQKQTAGMTDDMADFWNFQQEMRQTEANYQRALRQYENYFEEKKRIASTSTDELAKIEQGIFKLKNSYKKYIEARKKEYFDEDIKDQTKNYRDNTKPLMTAGMTAKEAEDWNLKIELEQSEKVFQEKLEKYNAYKNDVLSSLKKGSDEYLEAEKSITAKISEFEQSYQDYVIARIKQHYAERQTADGQYIKQKIQQWKDLNSQLTNLQDTMMEGFVTANEKWLDGDLNSWRDYANDVLKTLRNMALKQGYAELLGGITQGITNNVKGFFSAAFGIPNGIAGQNPKLAGQQQAATNGANAAASTLGATAGQWIRNKVTGTPTPEQVLGLGTGLNVVTNNASRYLTYSPEQVLGLGAGQSVITNNPGQYLTNGGSSALGGAMSNFGASAGVDKSAEALASAFDTVALSGTEVSSGMNILNTATTTLQGTQLGYNTTQLTGQIIEEAGQVIGQTSNTQEGQAAISTASFDAAVQLATTGLIQFNTQLAANKVSSAVGTALANGGIMTSSGPLPLKMYANGGIARTAQVAIFGEGRQPEAYVPLPDGRSIPVTINSNGFGEQANANGNNVVISINVTNNNEGMSTESGSSEGDSKIASNMQKLANNIKALVKQEIYNQSRPGGLLYNGR